MADMWIEAGEEARIAAIGVRYNWIPLSKPWYWVFSFWQERWENWGKFQPLKPSDAGYKDAQYECGCLVSRHGQEVFYGSR